jgi:hypothetical protein
MADREFVDSDAVRVKDAFEGFRTTAAGQMYPASLASIQEAARHRRRRRGYHAAVIVALTVLLPSAIGLGLVEAGSHRAGPAPVPSGTQGSSLPPTPTPTPTANVPHDVPACQDSALNVAVVAGDTGPGTWRALIGFTNISTDSCTIGGYPNVVAANQIGAAATGNANPADSPASSSYPPGDLITLAPGEQANAEIFGADIDAGGKSCPQYEWLRVTAPNGHLTWEISSFIPSGDRYAAVCGTFSVSALYPRSAYQYSPEAVISPTTSASAASAPCTAAQLVAHQTYALSVANQPLTIVAFYNVSTTACYLSGYVGIDAASAGGQQVPIAVTHSGNYERSDPGPSRFDVPPGGAASFAIGSGTAFGGGAQIITLTRLTLTLAGSSGQLQVTTSIAVSRPSADAPYPLSETALVAGTSGPNTG